MDRDELPLDTRLQGVPSGVPKMISTHVAHSAQSMQLCCSQINTISNAIKTSVEVQFDPRHLGVPSSASKMIFRAYGTFNANNAPILPLD
jgi:hypothetical protein